MSRRYLTKGVGDAPLCSDFFIIAIIAGVFGFGGISAGATEIAKILFYIFIIIFVV